MELSPNHGVMEMSQTDEWNKKDVQATLMNVLGMCVDSKNVISEVFKSYGVTVIDPANVKFTQVRSRGGGDAIKYRLKYFVPFGDNKVVFTLVIHRTINWNTQTYYSVEMNVSIAFGKVNGVVIDSYSVNRITSRSLMYVNFKQRDPSDCRTFDEFIRDNVELNFNQYGDATVHSHERYLVRLHGIATALEALQLHLQ